MTARGYFQDWATAAFCGIPVAVSLFLPSSVYELLLGIPLPPLLATAASRSANPALWHGCAAAVMAAGLLLMPFTVRSILATRTREVARGQRLLLACISVALLVLVALPAWIPVSSSADFPRFGFILQSRVGLAFGLSLLVAPYWLLSLALSVGLSTLVPFSKSTGAHPNNSSKPTPLRGAA